MFIYIGTVRDHGPLLTFPFNILEIIVYSQATANSVSIVNILLFLNSEKEILNPKLLHFTEMIFQPTILL